CRLAGRGSEPRRQAPGPDARGDLEPEGSGETQRRPGVEEAPGRARALDVDRTGRPEPTGKTVLREITQGSGSNRVPHPALRRPWTVRQGPQRGHAPVRRRGGQ